jgi:hypothetical protein
MWTELFLDGDGRTGARIDGADDLTAIRIR